MEAEAKRKEKQKQEAELSANLAAKERQKAIADSTQKARLKNQQDSIARIIENDLKKSKEVDENRKRELIKDKHRQDSLLLAETSLKQKAEDDRLQKSAYEKLRLDSIANVQRLQKEKAEQERQSRALAEIEAKKRMLAKANKVEEKVAPLPKTAPIPKIRDSDYREGVTDETINESNRIIYRTVVKKEGSTFNYQKIVYGWGGIFYFKNENSITEISFEQDIKNAKREEK